MKTSKAILTVLVITTIVFMVVYQPMFIEALLLGLSMVLAKTLSFMHWLVPNWGAAFFGFCCVFMGMFVLALCAINRESGLREKIARLNEWVDELEANLLKQESKSKDFENQAILSKAKQVEAEMNLATANIKLIGIKETLIKACNDLAVVVTEREKLKKENEMLKQDNKIACQNVFSKEQDLTKARHLVDVYTAKIEEVTGTKVDELI